jgi:hypothetical protein
VPVLGVVAVPLLT